MRNAANPSAIPRASPDGAAFDRDGSSTLSLSTALDGTDGINSSTLKND
jgi:hypothetical protein